MSGDLQILNNGTGWDLVLQGGDFVFVDETETDDAEAVGQRVVYSLMTWLGESVYARDEGAPYLQGVFAEEPVPGIVVLLSQIVLDTDGVAGFETDPVFALDNATRELSIAFVILTTAGQTRQIALTLGAP